MQQFLRRAFVCGGRLQPGPRPRLRHGLGLTGRPGRVAVPVAVPSPILHPQAGISLFAPLPAASPFPRMIRLARSLSFVASVAAIFLSATNAGAFTILGAGTGALLGGDLTD